MCVCMYLGVHRPAILDDGVEARCVCVVFAAGCAGCARCVWRSVSRRVRHGSGERARHHGTLRSTEQLIRQVICRNYTHKHTQTA